MSHFLFKKYINRCHKYNINTTKVETKYGSFKALFLVKRKVKSINFKIGNVLTTNFENID